MSGSAPRGLLAALAPAAALAIALLLAPSARAQEATAEPTEGEVSEENSEIDDNSESESENEVIIEDNSDSEESSESVAGGMAAPAVTSSGRVPVEITVVTTPAEPGPESSPEPESEAAAGASAPTIPSWDPGWGIATLGFVTLVAGAVTGGHALRNLSELERLCDAQGACPPGSGFASLQEEGEALARATDVLLVSGAAIGITGVILALVFADPEGADPEGAEPEGTDPEGGEPELEAGLSCGPTGCLATLRGSLP